MGAGRFTGRAFLVRQQITLLATVVLVTSLATVGHAQTLTVSHLMGDVGGEGTADGTGSAARLIEPDGLAIDAAGNVYVAAGHSVRKITPAGVVTTLAGHPVGQGSADGTGVSARFSWIGGVVVDPSGTLYVTDVWNQTIRKVTAAGVVTTLAGRPASSCVSGLCVAPPSGHFSVDGTGSAARFGRPEYIAIDPDGNLYVTDSADFVIRKITQAGVVTTLAGSPGQNGSSDGTGNAARFKMPRGIGVDASGVIYVADTQNCTIRRITSSGAVTTLAGQTGACSSSTDGTGNAARFANPEGLGVEPGGNLLVTDFNGKIRRVTPAGVVTTITGPVGNESLYYPMGVVADPPGNIYVANTGHATVMKRAALGGAWSVFAGSPSYYGDTIGARVDGVAVDAAGTTYWAESGSGSAPGRILKRTAAGDESILATLSAPSGVVVDTSGTLFVADSRAHTILRVTSGGAATTIAGLANTPGTADGLGAAARFNQPVSIAMDASGTLYVADSSNHAIRKITTDGTVTTLAGLAGTPGGVDGAAGVARFRYPKGITLASDGNLYVADTSNYVIRRVTPSGEVSTIAGTIGVTGSSDGEGTAARFGNPVGVVERAPGILLVSDQSTIRQVSVSGLVTTVAGVTALGGSEDGTGTAARFNGPTGLAVDAAGRVYIADYYNHAVRIATSEAGAGLIVVTKGSGSGSVSSAPGGIACGADCDESVADGAVVTLTSTPDPGHAFTGWGGACSGTGPCQLTVHGAQTITATFMPLRSLTTSRSGSGTGTITANVAGISCGIDCIEQLPAGTSITLTAAAGAGSTFNTWSGTNGCSGSAPCTVTLRDDTTIVADFGGGLAPAVSLVAPAFGPLAGGTRIALLGPSIGTATAATIGGVAAPLDHGGGSDTSLVFATTPAAALAGGRDVVVTTPGGPVTVANGFTYVADIVTDLAVGDYGQDVPDGSDFLQPALSADGRFVAYVVTSDAVITGDTNGVPDVVVRDRATGALKRMSVATDGTQANGASGRPRISANGRYLAFWSDASNLAAGDTNGVRDVFVHDRDADGNGVFDEVTSGATTTTRVSVASNGTEADGASATDGEAYRAGEATDGQLDLSPDGGVVVFRSLATNLVAGDTNGVADIFLHGMTSGQTTRVSVASDGAQANGASQSPGVSSGGRRVVFASSATNLVAGDANGVRDVFLVDRSSTQTVRLSASSGAEADGASDWPSIDDAGVEVAFATLAHNIVPALATSTASQVVLVIVPWASAGALLTEPHGRAMTEPLVSIPDILRQIASGVLPPGAATVQPGDGASTQPEVCGDGTCLGYATDATNLTPADPDTNRTTDVVIQPIVTTATVPPTPTRVSRDSAGNPATEATTRVAVNGNGTVVAMESAAALTPQAATVNPSGINVFVRALPLVLATITQTYAHTDAPATLTLTGAGFLPGATVKFGSTVVPATVAADGRSLTVATPTGASAGSVPVTVTNPDGAAVVVWQFTFLAPEGEAPVGDADNDGLPDAWEAAVGLNPQSAAGADGADGDPDADGISNKDEYVAGTHPRGTVMRYLAEGATSEFFMTTLGLANPGTQPVHAWLRFQKSDGTQVPHAELVPAQASRTVVVNALAGLAHAEFATVIESDGMLAVHRTMSWDAVHGYGSHLEGTVPAPSTRWYLAEGSTNAGFQLFYLLQNPGAVTANVEIRYLLPAGAPVVRTYTVPAGARFNVWANTEPALTMTDVSAVVTSTNGVPIIVERAMYLDTGGQTFGAGHESAGVTAPARRWFLAEGATGSYFDLFILLANPGESPATVTATYLLPSGTTVTKTYVVEAQRRYTVWVDLEDATLADTAVSTTLVSDVPILAERAMWWPGGYATWFEAHNSFGATTTGTVWALGGGEVSGPPSSADTYVLVANTAATPATVTVTVLFEDGAAPLARTFSVAATSRFNVDVAAEFPAAKGKRFGVVVESVAVEGQPAAQIVVETANYHNDSDGHVWAAGANALATRIR